MNNYLEDTTVLKHIIATPLTTIIINSELALKNPEKTNFKIHLQKILANATYISAFLSKNEQTHSFDLHDAISSTLFLTQDNDNRIQCSTHISHLRNKIVQGDKLQFQESLLCILNNASEAYDECSLRKMISITASLDKVHKKVTLTVSDGGKGMTLRDSKKCTEYGYSTKKSSSGVGLFFAKQTIESCCKGTFSITSRPSGGTSVSLVLNLIN